MEQQTRTEFFRSVIVDKHIPAVQVQLFFRRAYNENQGKPLEQLRLLNLLAEHRPELEEQIASTIVQGF